MAAMKLAFSTNAYTRHDLSFALIDIAAAGFEGVEVLADRPHAFVDDLSSDQIAAIAGQIRSLGLGISNVNANCTFAYWTDAPPEPIFEPSLINEDPKLRADRARLIRKTIDFAAAIGADCVSITTGKPLGSMPPQKSWDELKRQLAPLLQHAHDRNVRIGIEQEPGLLIEWADEIAALADEMGSPLLGANLDTGHCAVMNDDIARAVRILKGRLWNVHVEDLPRDPRGRLKHYHQDPGTGSFDFAGLFAALESIGYDRYATVELYTQPHRPREAARASIAALRQFVPAEVKR
jgi:sugar phosphate isomerase/epimerase